jgi:hypothetical protein
MSNFAYWNLARKLDMFDFSSKLVWKIFFDDLHFTNSLNASTLIVRSSQDTNNNKTSTILKDLRDFSLFLHRRPCRF